MLLALDFSGKQTRELLGQRDLSMDEATAIIGKAIEKPDLKYVQLPGEQMQPSPHSDGHVAERGKPDPGNGERP